MVQIVKPDQRDMKLYDAPGATVQVSDPILGKDDCLAAGFTEYLEPSRLEWTFDYNEVFFLLKGELEVHAAKDRSRCVSRSGTWDISKRERQP